MASILEANLPSDDEGDEDYVPGKEATAGKVQGTGQKRSLEDVTSSPSSLHPPSGMDSTPSAAQVAKKAKVDALWKQLNQQTSSGKPTPAGLMTSLGRESKMSKANPDKFWKLSLMNRSKVAQKKSPAAGNGDKDAKMAVAKSALAAAKEARSTTLGQMQGKVMITETKKFGGEDVQVKKVVTEGSSEAEKAARPTSTGGFDAFMESIDGKKKVNVLDKSRSDWKDHKKSDAGLEEELETHKKSNDQYLDKQDFLERSSTKQYEKERDKRLASDIRTRGRL